MVDMIVDKHGLRIFQRPDNRMHLLRHFGAIAPVFDHGDDSLQVAIGALQPVDNGAMALMGMRVGGRFRTAFG